MEVAAWMAQWNMYPAPGGLILCAVSGGEDSMCLLHLLFALGREKNFRVAAVHLNHLMRGADAGRDEEFVRAFCAERDIPFYAGRCDVREKAKSEHITVEEAGRQARYDLFYEAASALGAEKIATAHHALDQTETVLLHLIRGTGPEGLAGIPPVRGRLIRPLLHTSKAEIQAYCKENGIAHVEDSTNADLALSRNRMRLAVLPELRKINPAAEDAVCRAAEICRTENAYLDELAAARLGEGTSVSCGALRAAPRALQPRMLRILISRLRVGKKDFSAAHFAALAELAAAAREGSALNLPRGVCAVVRGGALTFTMASEPAPELVLRAGENRWGGFTLTFYPDGKNFFKKTDTIALKYDMINQHISVRAWRPEDRLILPGSRGGRSVKRLFADAGVQGASRDALPVLCVDGRAAAVFSLGVDRRYAGGDCIIEIKDRREER